MLLALQLGSPTADYFDDGVSSESRLVCGGPIYGWDRRSIQPEVHRKLAPMVTKVAEGVGDHLVSRTFAHHAPRGEQAPNGHELLVARAAERFRCVRSARGWETPRGSCAVRRSP